MKCSACEKFEIIEPVKQSSLSIRRKALAATLARTPHTQRAEVSLFEELLLDKGVVGGSQKLPIFGGLLYYELNERGPGTPLCRPQIPVETLTACGPPGE
jgi:hypothetical protein